MGISLTESFYVVKDLHTGKFLSGAKGNLSSMVHAAKRFSTQTQARAAIESSLDFWGSHKEGEWGYFPCQEKLNNSAFVVLRGTRTYSIDDTTGN